MAFKQFWRLKMHRTARTKTSHFRKGLLGLAMLLLSQVPIATSDEARAGSPIGELQNRYPCRINKAALEITYVHLRDPATVGVEIGRGDRAILFVNERVAFEQPIEVVTFEYFSACEQASRLVRMERPAEFVRDGEAMAEVIFDSDCRALSRMQREGELIGSRGYQALLDNFYYEKSRLTYYNVEYAERANNIRKRCPY